MPHPLRYVVDMHVHLGRSRDGGRMTANRLRRLYKDVPVTHYALFPIDEPSPGPSYQRINRQIEKLSRQNHSVIRFARLDPHDKNAALKELKRCCSAGVRGIKLHPRAENFTPLEAEYLLEEVEKAGLPVLLHTAHEKHCHPHTWEALFLRHKKIDFILGHAGKDAYRDAADVASRLPNVYLDTSTLSYFRTGYLLKKVGAKKIVFGSDAPYSHPQVEWLKWQLLIGKNSVAQRLIFQDNPKRILGGLPE